MPARRSATTRTVPGPWRLRRATLADLDLLTSHRRRMFAEIRTRRSRAELDRADAQYRRWVRRELPARHFLAFVVETPGGRPAGSGAIWLAPTQPRPGRLGQRPRLPYILSMFTEPAFRGRGVASRIVRAQVRWARERGYARIYLHASAMGRPVYARLGFAPGNEMRRDLPSLPRRRAR